MKHNGKLCPNLMKGETDLVKIWHSLVSIRYTKRIHKRIEKPRAGKYKDINQYIDAYMKYSEFLYELSQGFEAIPYTNPDLQPVPISELPGDREYQTERLKDETPTKPSSATPVKKKFFFKRPKSVSFVQHMEQADMSEGEVDTDTSDAEMFYPQYTDI
jgi:hypothetical protein